MKNIKKIADIVLNEQSYPPFGIVTGVVKWDTSRVKDFDNLTLKLTWSTSGRGDSDGEIVDIFILENNSGEESFSFKLPGEPYSFAGRLISLDWYVVFTCSNPCFTLKERFILSPNGEKIVLKKIDHLPGIFGKIESFIDKTEDKDDSRYKSI